MAKVIHPAQVRDLLFCLVITKNAERFPHLTRSRHIEAAEIQAMVEEARDKLIPALFINPSKRPDLSAADRRISG